MKETRIAIRSGLFKVPILKKTPKTTGNQNEIYGHQN